MQSMSNVLAARLRQMEDEGPTSEPESEPVSEAPEATTELESVTDDERAPAGESSANGVSAEEAVEGPEAEGELKLDTDEVESAQEPKSEAEAEAEPEPESEAEASEDE